MANGSILPPDIREEVKKQQPKAGHQVSPGGIGGRARGNAATAHQREVALGRHEEDLEEPAVQEEASDVHTEESKKCASATCTAELEPQWEYCPRCGADQIRGGAAKKLGIEFSEEDIQDYLFKGYVIRDIKILGKHTATMRSSQAKDLGEIDEVIMNGKWMKTKEGKDKQISDFYLRQMNAMALTAIAVRKVGGQSIGETLEERMDWLQERGSAFVDILAQKVTLFNRALTEYLKEEDSVLGS